MRFAGVARAGAGGKVDCYFFLAAALYALAFARGVVGIFGGA